MKRYVIYIDYRRGDKSEYRTITTDNIEQAIDYADRVFNPEEHYLMRIMQKTGKIEKEEDYFTEVYQAILCRRSYGWHRNTIDNSESEHRVKRCFFRNRNIEWFETLAWWTGCKF